ncbi:ParA family protein [Flectobacillus sp. BAB-3569]|uniref:ParA family protein n=1 Tax=Flectobacillus sp. BAB-3569 TaxID=1509483 RepID=UPI000BA36F61|nr:ParA family protein [Flectobacillus sp. BAB-3569]PAC26311.1 hypothetical protein BWI92_26200 [Flectobacillus sp. BAB-3569]
MVIAITNNKGGVGKTTSVLNIGGALAKLGHKVLLIDLDSQCNLSGCFNFEEYPQNHVGKFILKEATFEECVISKNGIDIIPSTSNLMEWEEKLSNKPRRDDMLKIRLATVVNKYDFILIDCPPNLGLLVTNAIFAAQYYLTPVEAGTFSYQGIGKLINKMNELNEYGADISLLGVLIIKYHQNIRGVMKKEIINSIRNSLGESVLKNYIRIDSNIDKAQLEQQTIFEYSPESNGAKDYLNVTLEILEKL